MSYNYGEPTFHLYVELPNTTQTLWDYALWDTGTWESPSVGEVDLWQYVRSGGVTRGRQRPGDRYSPGSASFTLANPDGLFSPKNTGSIYAPFIRPWRRVRFTQTVQDVNQATPSTVELPIWQGWVKDWKESYPGQFDSTIDIQCVDALAYLARFNLPEQDPQGTGDTAGERIHRILNSAGFDASLRDIADGVHTMQATTLAQVATEMLYLTADSEGSELYVSKDGKITFPGQGAHSTFGNPDIYFADKTEADLALGFLFDDSKFDEGVFSLGTSSILVYNYSDIDTTYEAENFANYVWFAGEGLSAQYANDPASITLNGTKTYSQTNLIMQTEPQALTLAQRYVAQFGSPQYRFSYLTVYLHKQVSYWSLLRFIDLGTVVKVYRSPNGAFTYEQDCFIDGIEHSFPAPGVWITRLFLRNVLNISQGY